MDYKLLLDTAVMAGEILLERGAGAWRRGGAGRAGLDDAHLAFGFGDLQLGDVRFRHQIDQGLQFAQIHACPLLAASGRRARRVRRSSMMNWRFLVVNFVELPANGP